MADNNERYVFNCFSKYVEGGKETVCNLNPAIAAALGIEFAQPKVEMPVAPAVSPGEKVEVQIPAVIEVVQ